MNERRVTALPTRDDPSPADVAARRGELGMPRDARGVMLGGIFTLLLFHALYVAQEIFVPIFFALFLNLLLTPVMRALSGLRVPRPIAAFLVIIAVFLGISALGYSLAGPAAEWLAKAPQTFSQMEYRLRILRKP